MAYDNSNSGTMGRNKDRDQPDANPKWPEYKGKANIGGVDYWISGWVRAGKDGSKFFSLKFKQKGENHQPQSRPQAQAPAADFDDEIPF